MVTAVAHTDSRKCLFSEPPGHTLPSSLYWVLELSVTDRSVHNTDHGASTEQMINKRLADERIN